MSARHIKVHFIAEQNGRQIRTSCGKDGHQADRWAPMHGMPGEYDTSICDRFEATTFTDDVTCIRCKRSVEKQR